MMKLTRCAILMSGLLLAAMFLDWQFCDQLGYAADKKNDPTISDYRKTPEITPEEIEAIELLRESKTSFIFGMNEGTTECFIRPDGSVGGSAVLISEWLTNFFGIPFELSIVDRSTLLNGLESGEIDITAEITPTEKRLSTFHMSVPFANRMIIYLKSRESGDISDPPEGRLLRYGFLEDDATFATVAPFITTSFDIVPVENYDEAYLYLKSGVIDAFFLEDNAKAYFDGVSDVSSHNFLPLLYNAVSLSTQNASLTPIISVVNKFLKNGGTSRVAEFYAEGFLEYRKNLLFSLLTDQEREYLIDMKERNESVKMALEYDTYPVSFYNDKEQEWQGIALDVLHEIGVLTGLIFVPANAPKVEWSRLLEMLETGEAQMTGELLRTTEREGRFLWTDVPYMTDYFALISTSDFKDVGVNQLAGMRIGLIADTGALEMFRRWFPNHENTVEYDDVIQGYDALERGEIHLLMNTRNQLAMVTNYLERPIFKSNLVFPQPSHSFFGLHQDQTALRSIICKAQLLVNTDIISDHWQRRVFDYKGKLAREQAPYLIGISVLMVVILILLGSMLLRHRQIGRRLEATVRERTRELAVQTAAAQDASRTKSEFLANMSHEIRTPMNAILGLTHLALQTGLNEQQSTYINHVDVAAKSLLRIINDILDFSKIEAGKLEMEETDFYLSDLTSATMEMMSGNAKQKGLNFFLDLPEDIPDHLIGDSVRLGQVINNLLSNAIKFTAKGEVRLSVRTVEETDESAILRFTVKDSGIGLTQEQVGRLFTAFTQADASTTRKYGGTGLGLAISKLLVEMMGGEIWCESEPGSGSTFGFTARFKVAGGASRSRSENDNSSSDADLVKAIKNAKILLVEDNEINQLVASEILQNAGFEVTIANNGREALEVIQKNAFDLVFMDIQMPEMDGLTATREIRKIDRLKDVPIIAMTANAMSGDREESINAGMNDHVSKPIDITNCFKTMLKWIPAKR
jgi:signal transduction histidine kinase/ActR/RegA family two-component response regulator